LISEQKQEVEHQKHIVDEKQKEIVDIINYAVFALILMAEGKHASV
jgi:hypothetical protein